MSDEDEPSGNHSGQPAFFREQDRLLPVANVGRIMKRAVPNIAKVSKSAKETVQECVSEFIGFVTSEASDLLQAEKRKTITGDDLMNALNSLGFEAYAPTLQEYLIQIRTEMKTKKAGADGVVDPNEPIKKTRGRKRKRPPSPPAQPQLNANNGFSLAPPDQQQFGASSSSSSMLHLHSPQEMSLFSQAQQLDDVDEDDGEEEVVE
jgi:nuclear transcription Y subunit beta